MLACLPQQEVEEHNTWRRRSGQALALGAAAGVVHRLEVAALWQEHLLHLAGQAVAGPGHGVPQVGEEWNSFVEKLCRP